MVQKKSLNFLNVGMISIFSIFFIAAAPQVQAPRFVSQDPDGDMILEATVDKNDVYPDEPILLSYHLLTRYDTRYEGTENEEANEGFWFKDTPIDAKGISREIIKRNGKRYVRASIRKKFYFPHKAGNYEIIPANLKISIRPDSAGASLKNLFSFSKPFFSKRENVILGAPPINIKVREFPPAPTDFSGSLGSYTVRASLENPYPPDGIYILNIKVEGEGNLWHVTLPKIDFGSALEASFLGDEVYDKANWKNETVTGSKIFRYELAPKRIQVTVTK